MISRQCNIRRQQRAKDNFGYASFEPRQLLATVSFDSGNGILTVIGTDGADQETT